MKNLFKTLSILFNYPGEEFAELVREADAVRELLAEEDEEAARLVHEFLRGVDLEKADEEYVAVFELPAACPLYAHYYTMRDKQSQVGMYLLEIKTKFKMKGYDINVSKELPDFLPVMLEFLSKIADSDPRYAYDFAKRYILSWLDPLERCLEKNKKEYTLLVKALRRGLERLREAAEKQQAEKGKA